MKRHTNSLSRREFARQAALGTAAASASFIPFSEAQLASATTRPAQLPADAAKLSLQSQAEADFRYQSIVAQYPDRFSDVQKAELKRLCFAVQPQLDRLRAWPVANSDQPALYLKPLVEREKKSNAAPNLKSASPANAPTKPASTAKP
ncbi:MAG TPA: hypothetical protein VN749_01705 [Candidatus Eisenbacteria bacterium]|jgi:hypothetical protein|nr:hypothetical protein [Candidatus Eisenbacteria bacterium]